MTPEETLKRALESRHMALWKLEEANEQLADAIRQAQSQGLRGDHLAKAMGMTRSNVSYLLAKYG